MRYCAEMKEIHWNDKVKQVEGEISRNQTVSEGRLHKFFLQRNVCQLTVIDFADLHIDLTNFLHPCQHLLWSDLVSAF